MTESVAIVVVTHNPAFAERMPRVVRMRDGRVEVDDVGREQRPVEQGVSEVSTP